MSKICIARDFSEVPGARNITDGDYSGEKFREKLLIPEYKKSIEQGEKLEIDFDGCYGFATSFLEEAFGGLVRKIKTKGILNNIELNSTEDISLVKLVRNYVEEAERKI